MHIQFLVEDTSGGILIKHIMEKLKTDPYAFTYDCKTFKGIGGFKKTAKIGDIKTNKLLDDLLIFLKGFDRAFRDYDAAVFVVLDNDKRCTSEFKYQLQRQAEIAMISIDHVFCIAVGEMEAWLLGDKHALLKAFPGAKEAVLRSYKQDSICGTWEILADAIYKGGIKKFKNDCPTYREIGKYKAEWADRIGKYMLLNENVSPSFQYFISELSSRLSIEKL